MSHIDIANASPGDLFIGATWALIRATLPKEYFRTEEYEYTIEHNIPISIEVWKKGASRDTKPKVIILNNRDKSILTPVIQRLMLIQSP
jgi:hypothetical protein